MTETDDSRRLREIVMASAEGMAIIDAERRYVFVTPRYAALAEAPIDKMIGLKAVELHPTVSWEPHITLAQNERRLERLEHQYTDKKGRTRWNRVTLVPIGSSADQRVAVLSFDVSDLRRAELQRRSAQQRLTLVEDEQRRRICRQLHDGPIQLLSALSLRLSLRSERTEEMSELLTLVERCANELRDILTELDPPDRDARPGQLLQSWVAPLLEGSSVTVTVADHTLQEVTRASSETLFIVLYEILGIVRSAGEPCVVQTRLAEHKGGHEFTVSIPRDSVNPLDAAGSRQGAIQEFVESVGGSLQVTTSEHRREVRTWTPALTEHEPVPQPELPSRTSTPRRPDLWIDAEDALGEVDWKSISSAVFEGLLEVDADLRVTYANASYAAAMRRPISDLIGLNLSDVFFPADYRRVLTYVERLRAGNTIRFEWRRQNAKGEPRWTQVSGIPKIDELGNFEGALLITVDTSGLHQCELIRRSTLEDLSRVREGIQRRLIKTLETDAMDHVQGVIVALTALTKAEPGDGALGAIQSELEREMVEIEGSMGQLHGGGFDVGHRSAALRQSLRPILEASGVELIFSDEAETTPAHDQAAALFHVAREAVANAATHGKAGVIRITLRTVDNGYQLEIRDDGVGADPENLAPTPGHLGVRSMVERVADMGGHLTLGPDDQGGLAVIAWLPGDYSIDIGGH